MSDKKVEAEFKLKDEYSSKARDIVDANRDVQNSFEQVKGSSLEANVQFMATMESIDQLGSSISQLRGGLQDTGLVTDEQAKKLQKLVGAADLAVGSSRILVVAQRALTNATERQIFAATELALVTGSIASAYMAINAETNKEKALYSALTGITLGLAAAQFIYANAKIASTLASFGPLAPIIAPLIIGGIAAVATYLASLKASAQTEPGEMRVVEQTGLVLVHQGETIGRVSEPVKATRNSQVSIYVDAKMTTSPEELGRVLADYMRWAV